MQVCIQVCIQVFVGMYAGVYSFEVSSMFQSSGQRKTEDLCRFSYFADALDNLVVANGA